MTSREFVLDIPPDAPDSVAAHVKSFDVAHERAYRSLVAGASEQAKTLWREMDDETRAALVSLVREALTELSRDPDSWLADGLVARDNEMIGISMLFRLGSIDAHVLQLRSENEAAQRQRIADLERISANAVDTPA